MNKAPFVDKRHFMTDDPATKKVLVTGASGFIALHTILHLLELGYAVRGTLRSAAQQAKVRATLSEHAYTGKLDFAFVDLTKDEGWPAALQGCDFVLHLASPAPLRNPRDENELIIPARDGTLRVLRAAHAQKIGRVVLLSSMAAVAGGHRGENRNFDENDWADLRKTADPYQKSKTIAERAAWDFIHSEENKNGMELAAVNPSYVFGPALDDHYFASSEWVRTLMRSGLPGLSNTQLNFVDVRDVAQILVKAMTTPAAAGKRFLGNGASVRFQEFALILEKHFASRGYRIPTRVLPDALIRLTGVFIPKVKRTIVPRLGWNYTISTEQTRSVLGWQPRPAEDTIVEMAESLIVRGLI